MDSQKPKYLAPVVEVLVVENNDIICSSTAVSPSSPAVPPEVEGSVNPIKNGGTL